MLVEDAPRPPGAGAADAEYHMHLTVNGEPYEFPDAPTVSAVLAAIGAEGARSAVLVGDEVVRASAWDTFVLSEGDRMEVVTFAGGG
jgi:thiamine biosynthesis protein ThiS